MSTDCFNSAPIEGPRAWWIAGATLATALVAAGLLWWGVGGADALAAPPPPADQPLFGQTKGDGLQVHALAHLLLALTVVIIAARALGPRGD